MGCGTLLRPETVALCGGGGGESLRSAPVLGAQQLPYTRAHQTFPRLHSHRSLNGVRPSSGRSNSRTPERTKLFHGSTRTGPSTECARPRGAAIPLLSLL